MPDGDDPRLAVVTSRIFGINRNALEDGASLLEVDTSFLESSRPFCRIEHDPHPIKCTDN